MLLVSYCLILFSAATDLLVCWVHLWFTGCHVCTVGLSYHLVLYLGHHELWFMYHVVSFTVLLCNLMFNLSLLDFLYLWHLSVSL